jgi:alkylation response protein AidB-like acyl-CoA dehydrogenase
MYVMGTVLRHGSEDQKARYLPRVASGELRLQAFGVTEPSSGTDTTSIRTFAKRDGDGYVVNGQKIWTSRAEYSDLDVAPGPHNAARPGRQAHGGSVRLHPRHARGAQRRPDDPADPHDDEPRDTEVFSTTSASRRRTWSARRAGGSATSCPA